MSHHKDLLAYQKGYTLAIKIYNVSKRFPPEERFSLTDQIRRSSRSVCVNLAEAYKRRRYKDYFISKINDSETDNTETEVWLDFAKDCSLINNVEYHELITLNSEVGKLIWYMINNQINFYNHYLLKAKTCNSDSFISQKFLIDILSLRL